MKERLDKAAIQSVEVDWNPDGTPTNEGTGRLNSIVFSTVLILVGLGVMAAIPFLETDSPLLDTPRKKLILEGVLSVFVAGLFFNNARFSHSIWSKRPPTRGH